MSLNPQALTRIWIVNPFVASTSSQLADRAIPIVLVERRKEAAAPGGSPNAEGLRIADGRPNGIQKPRVENRLPDAHLANYYAS